MSKIEEWLESEPLAFPNVYYLQKNKCLLDDKYLIIGCTLWTNIDPAIDYEAKTQMNDYKKITNHDGSPFTPSDCRKLYEEHTKYIVKEINKALEDGYMPLVITHHLPSLALIHEKYADSPLNSCYASPFLDYLHDTPSIWFYGHSHVQGVKEFRHTKCCINALGYPGERQTPPEPATVDLPTV